MVKGEGSDQEGGKRREEELMRRVKKREKEKRKAKKETRITPLIKKREGGGVRLVKNVPVLISMMLTRLGLAANTHRQGAKEGKTCLSPILHLYIQQSKVRSRHTLSLTPTLTFTLTLTCIHSQRSFLYSIDHKGKTTWYRQESGQS